jgi:hypothetical protein
MDLSGSSPIIRVTCISSPFLITFPHLAKRGRTVTSRQHLSFRDVNKGKSLRPLSAKGDWDTCVVEGEALRTSNIQ